MRHIRFNYLDESTVIFSIYDLVTLDTVDGGLEIILRNERRIFLRYDIDEFCSKVYSDEHDAKEYALIEIDEIDPPATRIQGMDPIDFVV